MLEPQLSLLPQIESNGLMHMAGFFPSVPTQIRFELLYAPVQGQWKLFGISVSLGLFRAYRAERRAGAKRSGKAEGSDRTAQLAAQALTPLEMKAPGRLFRPGVFLSLSC